MPTSWPIARKSKRKRFMAKPSHAMTKGIPLLFVLRDVLAIARTRKDASNILHNGDIKVNGIVRRNENFPMQVLDTLSLEKLDKYYRLQIVNKKFTLKEISKKEASEKIVKIIGKKVLDKKNVQVNFEDGNNMILKDSCNVGDSVVFNASEKKVVKVLPLKEKAKVEIIEGKHAGKQGTLVEVKKLRREKVYTIKFEDGQSVDLPYKTILVIG